VGKLGNVYLVIGVTIVCAITGVIFTFWPSKVRDSYFKSHKEGLEKPFFGLERIFARDMESYPPPAFFMFMGIVLLLIAGFFGYLLIEHFFNRGNIA
jgi:hypothetical protein